MDKHRTPDLGGAAESDQAAPLSFGFAKSPSVPIRTFREALVRLEDAVARGAEGSDDVHKEIAQASSLVKSLIALKVSEELTPDHYLVPAVLFVRDRVQYQSAAVATFSEQTGMWVWRPASELPKPPPEFQRRKYEAARASYTKYLAGRPVVDVFRLISDLLPQPSS
jgi:hypothetical protein